MKYKLLLLDIDGTLRPGSCERVPKENAEAVEAAFTDIHLQLRQNTAEKAARAVIECLN